MPVYNHSYQTWTGERRGPLFRWLAIPKFTYMEFMNNRLFIWLFTVAWFQFILRLAWLYVLTNPEFLEAMGMSKFMPQFLQVTPYFFKSVIDIQLPLCFFLAFMLGSNLIARDLAHGAIVLYASKPISRWEYFLGKLSVLIAPFLLLTWVQAALLFLVQTVITPKNSEWRIYFWERHAGILVAITLYCLVAAVTINLMILAASSLAKVGRHAGMSFVIYIIAAGVIGRILKENLQSDNWMALSPLHVLMDLGTYIFKLDGRHLIDRGPAWAGAIGLWVVSFGIIKWRITSAIKAGK